MTSFLFAFESKLGLNATGVTMGFSSVFLLSILFLFFLTILFSFPFLFLFSPHHQDMFRWTELTFLASHWHDFLEELHLTKAGNNRFIYLDGWTTYLFTFCSFWFCFFWAQLLLKSVVTSGVARPWSCFQLFGLPGQLFAWLRVSGTWMLPFLLFFSFDSFYIPLLSFCSFVSA